MKDMLEGQKVVLGYSGGPDAVALAYRLVMHGADIIPAYIHYRKVSGGKTTKDIRAARASIRELKIRDLLEVRAPLRDRPKSERNQHFVKVLAFVACMHDANFVALGTIDDGTDRDLNPKILSRHGCKHGVEVITWDTFDVREKAHQFHRMNACGRRAIFQTTSCQLWWRVECGNCHSCKARHAAFLSAFGEDPTIYRSGSKADTA